MTPTLSVPIEQTADGTFRIGGTRVTLNTVVTAFLQGAVAEGIVLQYSSRALAGVYAVISYYLQHKNEITTYLRQRQERADSVRAENEARFSPDGIRA